jgi:lipid-A-disaccharide synthase
MKRRVLVIAAEPSADRTLAQIVGANGADAWDCVGIGGDALAALGVDRFADVPSLAGMGAFGWAPRAPRIARALLRLERELRRGIDLALLCSWSFANARIGAWLRRRGVPVVWVGPPEVWAWRPSRAAKLARSADVMICTLPFEPAIWRHLDVDARYFGHPATELAPIEIRSRDIGARRLALLPGSRTTEVERLLPRFLDALALVRARLGAVDARLIVAPNLAPNARASVERAATSAGIEAIAADPAFGAIASLDGFDAALVASGTASLECALAGCVPVIAYEVDAITAWLGERWLRTSVIGLPNVLLTRAGEPAAFAELVGTRLSPIELADRCIEALEAPTGREACRRVRDHLRASEAAANDHLRAGFGARARAYIEGLRSTRARA